MKMPEVYEFLSHRVVDLTTCKYFMENFNAAKHDAFMKAQEKCKYTHRAMDDVEASIQAFSWCRDHMLVK